MKWKKHIHNDPGNNYFTSNSSIIICREVPFCLSNQSTLIKSTNLLIIENTEEILTLSSFFAIKLHVITTIVGIFIVMESARAFNQFPRFDQQYHIQTDQGANRFFRYQTLNGIYRKEQRHPDGSVVGTYGWVDPHNIFRLYDYVSDEGGYRIERKQLLRVSLRFLYFIGFYSIVCNRLLVVKLTIWDSKYIIWIPMELAHRLQQ